MAKLGILIGFGAGYVLGARAGRERYEQLVSKTQAVWRDPRVQRKTSQVQGVVADRASQAAGAAKETVAGAVKDKMPGHGEHAADPVVTNQGPAPTA